MNNNKGNMILLTIIAVSTLLVAVVGTTFSYFGAIVKGGDSASTIEVNSGTLSIEFDGDSKISCPLFTPGQSITKNITVSGLVTGSSNLNYKIKVNVTNNTYAEGKLVYTLTSSNPSSNGTEIESINEAKSITNTTGEFEIGSGLFKGPSDGSAYHSYMLTITYNGTEEDALNNPDRDFNAQVIIGQ